MKTFSFRIDGAAEVTSVPFIDTPFTEGDFDHRGEDYITIGAKKIEGGMLLENFNIRNYNAYRYYIESSESDPLMALWHFEIEDNRFTVRRIHSLEGDPCYIGDVEITISFHDTPQVDIHGNSASN